MSAWEERDFGEVCIAVVANGPASGPGSGTGCLLWWRGASLEYEVEEEGLNDLEDLGLDNAPHGISIWEGRYVAAQPPAYASETVEGTFRRPTELEWRVIVQNRAPWDAALEDHEFAGHDADCALCGEGRCHYLHGEACSACGSHPWGALVDRVSRNLPEE